MLLWHADRDLQGVDAVIVPGGFSYGDYLRAGAIARFAPVMEDVIAFARDGGPGARDLQRLPGPVRGRPASRRPAAQQHLRFRFRQVTVEVLNAETAFTRACTPGERLSIPCKHMTGRYWAPDDELDRLQESGQIVLRYAQGENPNGSARDVAGVCNEAGNVMGLMPHPEHAVDELCGGSADGLKLFASAAVAHA